MSLQLTSIPIFKAKNANNNPENDSTTIET